MIYFKGTKLRNRMLRTFAFMPMGNKLVSVAHLKILLDEVPKEIHGLNSSDVCPRDRQNFRSLEKCMDARVVNTLLENVADSEGTAYYLQLCKKITSSLMDYDRTPLDRIEKMFHAVYFLRIWRVWIQNSGYSLKTEWITKNAYMCAEVNAENLVKLIRRFRDEGTPERFVIPSFSSQPCEELFRRLRAMGTANFTKINFTIQELLHMIGRLEVQNDILYTKLSGLGIPLPKLESKDASCKNKIYELPIDEEIDQTLERAKRFAISDAIRFGMDIDPSEIDVCSFPIPKFNVEEECDNSEDEEELENDLVHGIENDEISEFHDSDYDDHDNGDEVNTMSNQFTTFNDHSGKIVSIRKSTLVWLLSDGTKKISNDRLTRVQLSNAHDESMIGKSRLRKSHNSNDLEQSENIINVARQINIGDWCFFKYKEKECKASEDVKAICIGRILAFKLTHGRTAKEKVYKSETVDLNMNPKLADELDVLCSWYFLNDRARLEPVKTENHFFSSLKDYIVTILVKPSLDLDTNTLYFQKDHFERLDKDISTLI